MVKFQWNMTGSRWDKTIKRVDEDEPAKSIEEVHKRFLSKNNRVGRKRVVPKNKKVL